MDEVDLAQKQNERATEAALTYRKPVPKIAPVGECHFCGDEVEGFKLFCNGQCAARYERVNKA